MDHAVHHAVHHVAHHGFNFEVGCHGNFDAHMHDGKVNLDTGLHCHVNDTSIGGNVGYHPDGGFTGGFDINI